MNLYPSRWMNNNLCRRLQDTSPPIIVVGMHRSGTSLLVELLERSGVRMGVHQVANHESVFFQNMNKMMLEVVGYGWRSLDLYPETDVLLDRYDWLSKQVQKQVQSGVMRSHLGLAGRFDLFRRRKVAWGWKDPRNCLTLPLWHRVFPNAKIIHIYRDGRDVALSLMRRDAKRLGTEGRVTTKETLKRFVKDFELWEIYNRRAMEGMHLFDTQVSVKYEKLLAQPEEIFGDLLARIGVCVQHPLTEVVSLIDVFRANRHADIEWIRDLHLTSALLDSLGYGPSVPPTSLEVNV